MAKRVVAKKYSNYNWRYIIVLVGLSLLAGSLSARVVYLQVADKEFLVKQADARSLRFEKIPANRGMITDRN